MLFDFTLNIEILAFLAVAAYVSVLVLRHIQYKKTSYYQVTHKPYRSLDAGDYGEYLIYKNLKGIEKEGSKFLFNLYIPKLDGGTSEIDVLLISHKGLFVFESKNFSGWIFGHQQQKYWTQSLPVGRGYESSKLQFYNPIWQNAGHILHLKKLIGEDAPIHSVVVFSDECTLKNITITTDDVNLIHQQHLRKLVSSFYDGIEADLLSSGEISEMYNKLYPYSQTDLDTREKHIDQIG